MTTITRANNILAGIVLYRPPSVTRDLVRELTLQRCDVCLFVNGFISENDLVYLKGYSVKMILNSENIGLAKALNSIISFFIGSKYNRLFLFDQDSMPDPSYVETMVAYHKSISQRSSQIVCLAPKIWDTRLGLVKKTNNLADLANTNATTAITSGCMFTKDLLETTGLMDEKFFIDGIDHEWCFRAQARGAHVYICPNAILHHTIGDKTIRFGWLHKTMHHSPVRHYYIIRNSIYLTKKTYIPKRWRIIEMLKTVRRAVAYPIFSPSPGLSLRMVTLGLIHGLQGRMGKLNDFPH